MDLAYEDRFGPETDDPPGRCSVLEEERRGDSHDAVLHGDMRVSVNVQFVEFHDVFVLAGQFFEYGFEHCAGGTPICLKVEDEVLPSLQGVLQSFIIYFDDV